MAEKEGWVHRNSFTKLQGLHYNYNTKSKRIKKKKKRALAGSTHTYTHSRLKKTTTQSLVTPKSNQL